VSPVHPRGDAWTHAGRYMGTGIALDECLHGRHVVQTFTHRHRRDQQGEPGGNQPQQVEPLVAADPQSRRDRALVFQPAGPGLRVDDVFSRVQLRTIAGSFVPIADIRGVEFVVGHRISHLRLVCTRLIV
jgi:hypothetical protein